MPVVVLMGRYADSYAPIPKGFGRGIDILMQPFPHLPVA